MILTKPVPPREALASLGRRAVTPTGLSSAQIRELGSEWIRGAFTSARTMLEDLLVQYKADVASLVNPERVTRIVDGKPVEVTEGLNLAKAREQAKMLLLKLGYQPDPEKRGTIEDLSSDARINLVLKTNKQMAQGEAWYEQGQNQAVLDTWPAQELFRAEGRAKEREWLQRWRLAGQASGEAMGASWTVTPDGRMIALKESRIWERLGDAELFDDGLGNAWPPFAFNSGMDVRDVDREEAIAIGLLTAENAESA